MPFSDLQTAYNAITASASRYQTLEKYYEGNQPTVYLTDRLKDIFQGVNVIFTQNWCAVVIDALKERINLRGFKVEDEATQAKLDEIWRRNRLQLESDDVHEAALVQGDAVIIAWDDGDGAEAYFNEPAMVHVQYSSERPREILWAAKLWTAEDKTARMTLYYADHLEYYGTTKPLDPNETLSASVFVPLETPTAPNPTGRVPVFHFRPNRKGRSELANVVPIQNGINKLLADMLVSAEYAAFRQRWVIGNFEMPGKLSSQPGSYHEFPAGDGQGQQTSVGEFSATELSNFLEPIDKLAGSVAAITRTPKHYFFGQGGEISGEALIALEAPLNKKAQDRIDRFIPVWQELASYLLALENVTVDPNDIVCLFDEPATIQPRTSAEIVKIWRESEVPLKTALRWIGKDETEIEEMEQDQAEQDKKAKASLGALMAQSMREFDAGQNPGAQGMNGGRREMNNNGGMNGGTNPQPGNE